LKGKNMRGKRTILFGFMLLPFLAASLACASEPVKEQENWYALYMMGPKLGYSHEQVFRQDLPEGAQYTSTSDTYLKIKRMGMVIEVVEKSNVIEDSQGRLISFMYYSKQSERAVTTEGRVVDGKITWTTKTGDGAPRESSCAYDPAYLPPRAAEALMKKKGLVKGTAYEMKVFMPNAPDQKIVARVHVVGVEDVTILGRRRSLIRVDQNVTVRGMPILSQSWMDENWVTHKTKSMGTVDLIRMPRELAMKEGPVEEVFIQSIIPSNCKIPNARKIRKLEYRLHLPKGESFDNFPTGMRQTVLKKGEGFIEMRVEAQTVETPLARPVKTEEMAVYLKSTSFLQSDDARVKKIAAEVAGEETDSLVVARKLEKWVHREIKEKNFGVGFATAAEVAKNLEGDCSEHGVLLAALCRAAGIPSRVVAGVIYADVLVTRENPDAGGFGFHMWTEVFVGKWVALDATLGHGFADATHITLARSALETESSMYELIPISTYLGKLKIEVLIKVKAK
jgi:hypothetical protein